MERTYALIWSNAQDTRPVALRSSAKKQLFAATFQPPPGVESHTHNSVTVTVGGGRIRLQEFVDFVSLYNL